MLIYPPPFLRLIYVIFLSALLFFIQNIWAIIALVILQLGILFFAQVQISTIFNSLKRLKWMFFIVFLSFLFVPSPNAASLSFSIQALHLPWPVIHIYPHSLVNAALLLARVVVMILASLWFRETTQPKQMSSAFKRLYFPESLSILLAVTLHLFAGAPGSKNNNKSGNKQNKQHKKTQKTKMSWHKLRTEGLSSFKQSLIKNQLASEQYILSYHPEVAVERIKDYTNIVSYSLIIMSLKVIQLMPGLPIAPGHKNLLIIPFFLAISSITQLRFATVLTGSLVGIMSFMLGFGKFGILEILQFILPAILIDLTRPLISIKNNTRFIILPLLGALAGTLRFSANLFVLILAGAPLSAFFVYLPALASQILFGAIGGFLFVIWRKHSTTSKTIT